MSDQFNNKPSLIERLKAIKLNRSAVISGCVLAIAIITVTAVAIANNNAKKSVIPTPNKGIVTEQPQTTEPTVENNKQEEQKEPSSTPTKPTVSVDDKLPSFSLPVNGALIKSHDPDIQVFSNTMNDYRVHLGVDIVTEQSAPVYAAADGKIDKIWEDVLMGYCIAIKHSGGCYTIYKNLAATLPEGIAEGVSVRSGQLIASVGESAMVEIAEEPHLHFEMTVADLSVDPLKYFDENALATLKIDASHGE